MLRLTFFALLLLAGCARKNPDPAPADPTPTASLSRSITSQKTSSSATVTYTNQMVKGSASLSNTVLAIGVDAKTDYIGFELNRSALGSQWPGDYTFRYRQRPTDPATVQYMHRDSVSTVSSIYYLSLLSTDLNGKLSITQYDAARQLISGTYTVQAPNQIDFRLPPDTDQRSTLLVTGSFTNLKIQAQ